MTGDVDWSSVEQIAFDLAPVPSWSDTTAGAVVWQLNGEQIRAVVTEELV
mgnify:CR=1 FL=1